MQRIECGWSIMKKHCGLLILSALLLIMHAASAVEAAKGPSVMVHFGNDEAYLDDKDKAKLRRLFQSYDIRGAGRVFILGYTDSHGNRQYNYRLSRKRAQSVRREIISAFGIDATIVMALGKGPENPIADNAKANGRALNRRAEIYLANVAAQKPKRTYGPNDPHWPKIKTLVKAADDLIRKRKFNDALYKLKQAQAIGGDYYSDWHTARGIVGYYADVTSDAVKAHLVKALKLDPYNYKAREFLSRVEARQMVLAGQITNKMGRSSRSPISVSTVAQEHEFLRLFGVEALSHRKLDQQPIVVWQCLNPNGRQLTYYFDHSQTFSWAFGQTAREVKPKPESKTAVPGMSQVTDPSAAPDPKQSPPSVDSKEAMTEGLDNPQRIWQSTLFK